MVVFNLHILPETIKEKLLEATTMKPKDPWGTLGRGCVILTMLLFPFLHRLESIAYQGAIRVSIVDGLIGIIFVTAILRIWRQEPLRPAQFIPHLVLLALAVIGILGVKYRGDAIAPLGQPLLEYLLLTASATVHFAGEETERWAVLASVVVMGLVVAVIGVVDFYGAKLSSVFLGGDALRTAEQGLTLFTDEMAMMMTISLVIATAAALAIKGKMRDVVALVIAVFWFALLATFSFTGPVAALVGMLLLLILWRRSGKPYLGISVAVFVATFFGLLHSDIRANWGREAAPFRMSVHSVTGVDGGEASDQLQLLVVNRGVRDWPAGAEIGYHVFLPISEDGESEHELQHVSWIGAPLSQSVRRGRLVEMKLPFAGGDTQGFILPDLKLDGVYLSNRSRLTYVLFYNGWTDEMGQSRLNQILPVERREIVESVNDALRAKLGSNRLPTLNEAVEDAKTLMESKPVVGFGTGAMPALFGYTPRSTFLNLLVGYGWLGMVLALGVFLWVTARLLTKRTGESLTWFALMMALVVFAGTTFAFADGILNVFFALLVGVAIAASYPVQMEE